MSQHHIYENGKKAVIGFDSRLDGYFLHIDDGGQEHAYTSLMEEKQYPSCPSKYIKKLKEHGFTINREFDDAISLESAFPLGNVVIHYKLVDGTQTAIKQ